jgi:hypothetical protein
MLKEYLKKVFSSQEDNTAPAETLEEVISMITEKDQAALVTDNTTADLTAQLSIVTESLTTLQADFAELKTNYEAAQVALSASADAQATLVANAKAKVMAERTASLTAVMGDVKGAQMATSLETLDDSTFATVLSGYVASFEAEEKSEMFTEKGTAAEALPVVEASVVNQLAASIAAKFQTK